MICRACFAALPLLVGCSSYDLASDVQGMPPAPLVVAVEPLANPERLQNGDALRFGGSAADFQRLVIGGLEGVNAASRVVTATAAGADADIVVRPRIASFDGFRHQGLADSFWASGALWLVTWIGGLAIEDSDYETNLTVHYEIRSRTDDAPIHTVAAISGPVSLSHLERNGFFSWSTLQAVILPPFLTSDRAATTGEQLRQRATADTAAELAKFLKQDYDARALAAGRAALEFVRPRNGATVPGPAIELRGVLRSPDEPVSEIEIWVNGRQVHLATGLEESNRPRRSPADPHEYSLVHTLREHVRSGVNFVRIRFATTESFFRTLRVDVESAG